MQFLNGVELPMVNYHTSSWRFLCQGNRFLATGFWLQKAALTQIPSLSPHLTYFVARFFVDCLCFCLGGSVSLTVSLAMGRVESRGADVVFGFVLVKGVDDFSEIYDYQKRFSGILFFWITFSYNQIV